MFDLGHVGQILVTILSHPAMAEITALAGFAMSIAQNKKSKTPYRQSTTPFLKKTFRGTPKFPGMSTFDLTLLSSVGEICLIQ